MSSEKNRPEATIDDGVSDGDAVPAALAAHKWIEGAAAEEDGLSPRVEDASALVAESKWSGASGMAADSIIDIGQTPPPDEPEGAGKVIPGEGVFPLGPDDDRAQSASRPPTGASAGDGRERKESYNDAPPNQAGEPEAQDVGVRSKTSSGGSASEKAAAEGQLSAADSADSKSRAMTPAEKKAAEKKLVTIRIRPKDGDWVMGEDHEMTLSYDTSIISIKRIIEEERGIHHERSNVLHPRSKKFIEKNRESWSLRRHGIGNKDIVVLSPTAPGGWTWHSIQYYHEKLINEIISEILLSGTYVRLHDMERKLVKPPPIKESMGVLVKQYPDRIHVRTELSTGHVMFGISMIGQSTSFYESKLVPVPKELMQLPTYEAGSVLSGTKCPPVDIYDFDWDSYADLDSVGFAAGAIVMPDTIYNIAIFSAFACQPNLDSFNPPNPFVDIYWNGKRRGRTPVRYMTFLPQWMQCKIQLRQGPNEDINNCHLRLNLFSFRDSSTCVLLGTIDFDGPQLKDLMSPQIDARIEEFRLKHFKPSARAMKLSQKVSVVPSVKTVKMDRDGEEKGKEGADEPDPTGDEAGADDDVAYNADLAEEEEAKAEKDFPHEALLEGDGSFETGTATVKVAILHCEFEVRVHFCQGLVNPEGTDVSPFVIVIFNGRDIGMTDVKAGENWPVWIDPPSYSMKIGTLDIFECSLNIEVWQMGSTGRENLLGQVVYAGKPFVDMVTDASNNYMRHVKELSMPIVRGKDKDNKAMGKGGKKAKAPTFFGKVCFDIGPVGLPPPTEMEFEISIIAGVMLPADNVYCQVYWDHVCIGTTVPAIFIDPLVDKPGDGSAVEAEVSDTPKVPPWTWEANKFTFAASNAEALGNSSLKIYLIDVGEKRKLRPGEKVAVIRLGCISLTGTALVDFLTTENSLSKVDSFDLSKDPDETRPQRPPRGSLLIRRGTKGARTEDERTFVVHAAKLALKDLNVSSAAAPRPQTVKLSLLAEDSVTDDTSPDAFGYFINAYFNDNHIGSGPHCIVEEGLDPFWNDSWFQLPVNGQPLKNCSLKLELMMYRVLAETNDNESSLAAGGSASLGVGGSASVGNRGSFSVGAGGSNSFARGSSSKKLGEEMLKPGEGLPFSVATLTLSGNDLKAVVGSKLSTKSEKKLEPIPVQKATKSKKNDKFNLTPDPLQTHQLQTGTILVGCPGSAVASPLDIIKADEKALVEKYNEYVSVLDVDMNQEEEEIVAEDVLPDPGGDAPAVGADGDGGRDAPVDNKDPEGNNVPSSVREPDVEAIADQKESDDVGQMEDGTHDGDAELKAPPPVDSEISPVDSPTANEVPVQEEDKDIVVGTEFSAKEQDDT